MSTIEDQHVPQKQKEFKKYSQDHGDAATQVVRNDYEYSRARRHHIKKDAEVLAQGLSDAEYKAMTPAKRDRVADQLLNEANQPVDSTRDDKDFLEGAADSARAIDRFPTEAEFGVRSMSEITREQARRVTLDPHEDDDLGDSDFNSPIRISRL